MSDAIKNSALNKAKQALEQIEELRADRVSLQIKQAKEIGEIDGQLNQLYAQLSSALSLT